MSDIEYSNSNSRHTHPPGNVPSVIPGRSHGVHHSDKDTLKNLSHCVSYVWDHTGNGSWIYPYEIEDDTIHCLSWNDPGWVERKILLDDIDTYF